MIDSNFLLPKALLKALGKSENGEDLGAIIVDLAAGGLIVGVANYIDDHRHIDHQPEHNKQVRPDQWGRVIYQGKVAEVWNTGTVRLDSDVKNHLYYLAIVGIRFEEAPVLAALKQAGVILVSPTACSLPGKIQANPAPVTDVICEPLNLSPAKERVL